MLCRLYFRLWLKPELWDLTPSQGPELRLQTELEFLNGNFSALEPKPHEHESSDPGQLQVIYPCVDIPSRKDYLSQCVKKDFDTLEEGTHDDPAGGL